MRPSVSNQVVGQPSITSDTNHHLVEFCVRQLEPGLSKKGTERKTRRLDLGSHLLETRLL